MRVNQINKSESKPYMLCVEMLSLVLAGKVLDSTGGMCKAQEV